MIEKAILHMARQPAVIAIDSLHRFLEFHPSATLNRRVGLREALCKRHREGVDAVRHSLSTEGDWQPVLLVAAAYSGGSLATSPVSFRELVEICELQFAAMAGDDVPIPVDRSPT
jgi:hypothetical protein